MNNSDLIVIEQLPQLPKLRKHKETDVTPAIRGWFKKNWWRSYALEIKIKGGKVQKHQPAALKQVNDGFFDIKLKDWGGRNPFDVIGLKDADAFIVVADRKHCDVYNYEMEWIFDFNL